MSCEPCERYEGGSYHAGTGVIGEHAAPTPRCARGDDAGAAPQVACVAVADAHALLALRRARVLLRLATELGALRQLLHGPTSAKEAVVKTARPTRARSPQRRPLPVYGGFDGRVKLCCGDCAYFFRAKDECEVRRLVRRIRDEPWSSTRVDRKRLESLIVDQLYDPAGSVR
jgi:hypothetical protein